jgi:hypothetical protein
MAASSNKQACGRELYGARALARSTGCWLQERLVTAQAMRFERAIYHDSKRFDKDEREVRAQQGFTCRNVSSCML